MLPDRDRTKKLIIAFHFQFSNQASWKCGACKERGLDIHRKCEAPKSPISGPPVWARGPHAMVSCPKRFITGTSLVLIEEFFTWKLIGRADYSTMPAKTVDAFVVLEREWRRESHDRDE